MLSTTSFAVLGMLAVRDWSAYELTKQAKRTFQYCWPKAESVLYDEPKRLVALGLARVVDDLGGETGRPRTVYGITEDGRAALREWLAGPPAPPRFELEVALRLAFADHGSKQDLLAAVAATRAWAADRAEAAAQQMQAYAVDGGPFPERLHITALAGDLFVRMIHAMDAWAADAQVEVASWRNTRRPGPGADPEAHLHVALRRLGDVGSRELGG